MGKNLMTMLPFTQYLRFLRAPKFTRGYWPRVIFGALRVVKNRVIIVFIIATLPVNLVKILFTRFLTAFNTPLFFCAIHKNNHKHDIHFRRGNITMAFNWFSCFISHWIEWLLPKPKLPCKLPCNIISFNTLYKNGCLNSKVCTSNSAAWYHNFIFSKLCPHNLERWCFFASLLNFMWCVYHDYPMTGTHVL